MDSPNYPRQYVSKYVPKSAGMITFMMILLSTADSMLLGYDSTLMGNFNIMPAYLNYFELTTTTKSLNTCIAYVGGAFSCLVCGFVADWMGRKQSINVACVITIIGAIIQTSAPNIVAFIIGRFIIGAGMGFNASVAPTYTMETAPEKWRPFALGLYLTNWGLGTIVGSAVCYRTQTMDSTWAWRTPSFLQIFFGLLCMFVTIFLPESPRWLAYNERYDETLETLAVVNASGNKDDELVRLQYREIVDTIQWEKTDGKQLTLREAYSHPANRKRLIISGSFSILVMMPGALITSYYFGTMLTQAGITGVTQQLQINMVMTVWVWLTNLFGAWLLQRMGRVMQASISMILQIITFYLFAGFLAIWGESTSKSGAYATIAMLFLNTGAYGMGISPMTTLYPAEVLSYRIRATGMALFTFLGRIQGVFVTMVFPFGMEAIGWKFYIFNASIDILMLLGVIFYYVETFGLTPEEVDIKFDGVKHSDVPDLGVLLSGKKKLADLEVLDAVPVIEEDPVQPLKKD